KPQPSEIGKHMETNDPAANVVQPKAKSPILPMIARLLLGLAFFVFGLNGFLNFIPQPKDTPENIASLMGAFMKTGYMFPLVFGTQLLVGVLLLLNIFVPLALAFLAPVLVHILAFHIFMAPSGIGPGLVATILELYLAWAYRDAFRSMLAAKVTPR